VLGTAEQFGLGNMPSNPSVVLGTAEVTPLQLTAAYGAFATLGSRPEPRFVSRVLDTNGVIVWSQQPEAHRIVDPAVAFIATSMMQDVVNRGTGTGVRAGGFTGPAAGKTGTTQDASDVWFVGFTPEIVGTVWIGFDRRQRILRGATGGELAAPIWGRMMRRITKNTGGWTAPAGVVERTVDEMGSIVSEGCVPQGGTYTEYFITGTAPSGNCYPQGYAYGDSLGLAEDWQYEPVPYDTADGWWERLRRRVLGDDDSVRRAGRPAAGDTMQYDPARAQRDTARGRDPLPSGQPRPLGEPIRNDTTRPPPPPDTGTSSRQPGMTGSSPPSS
jgi:penicillin-binding protein 1A